MKTTLVASALALAGMVSLPADPDPQPTMRLDLVREASIGSPSSLTDPGVKAVAEVLKPMLVSRHGMSPEEIVDEMERVLIDAYGASNVSVVELQTSYKLIFDPISDDWVVVCVPSSELSVDDGGTSPVLATAAFEVPYEVGDF